MIRLTFQQTQTQTLYNIGYQWCISGAVTAVSTIQTDDIFVINPNQHLDFLRNRRLWKESLRELMTLLYLFYHINVKTDF